MVSNIKSLIGALVLSGAGLLGVGNDAPVLDIAVANSVKYAGGKTVKVSTTNFYPNLTYKLEKSSNLTDWVAIYTYLPSEVSSPTNRVTKSIEVKASDPYFNKSFYRVRASTD